MNDSISLTKGTSEFTKRQRVIVWIFLMIPYNVIECWQETHCAYARTCRVCGRKPTDIGAFWKFSITHKWHTCLSIPTDVDLCAATNLPLLQLSAKRHFLNTRQKIQGVLTHISHIWFISNFVQNCNKEIPPPSTHKQQSVFAAYKSESSFNNLSCSNWYRCISFIVYLTKITTFFVPKTLFG